MHQLMSCLFQHSPLCTDLGVGRRTGWILQLRWTLMQPNHFFFHGWSNGFPSLWKERITGLDPQDFEQAPGARWLWVPTPSFPAVGFAPQFYLYKMGMMSLTRGCLAQGRYWRNVSSIYIPTFPPNSLHTQEKSENLEARRMGPFHVFPFFF